MNGYTGTDNLEVMAEAVRYNSFLLSLIREHAGAKARIVDIGAGIGTFALALRNDGYDVLCFEPDERQAEAIRSQGLPVATSFDSIEPMSLDFLYALNVLEHIEDDRAALRQWRNLLRPGGRMLVYVPAFEMLYSSMDRKVGHVRRYTKRSLTAAADGAQIRILTVRYADSIGFLASIAYKLFGAKSGDINRRALVAYDKWALPISLLIDCVLRSMLGKNVYLVGERPL